MAKNPSKYLGNELTYLQKVLDRENCSSTSGNWTNAFEKAFAQKIGASYGVAFNSGTSTLYAALEAVGVRPGDEVISPAITVIMDTTATIHANGIPVYADVDALTFNIDPKDVAKKVTPKTKAIIGVAIYGLSPDWDALIDIAQKQNIALIEDNAQAALSTYKGRTLGTIGDIASFSFENTKHLSTGEGGMLLTNNEKLAQNVRKIGGHGFKNLQATEGRIRLNQEVFQNPDYKRHDVLGWNYRMPEFCSAVGMAQLERLDELVSMRVKVAKIFMEVMKDCDYLIPQHTPDNCKNTYYTLGVVFEGKEKRGINWAEFRAKYVGLGGDGIYSAWTVPYLEPIMQDRQFVYRYPEIYSGVCYERGLCPVAETLQQKLMQFKTNYRDIELAKLKADYLYKTIKYFG